MVLHGSFMANSWVRSRSVHGQIVVSSRSTDHLWVSIDRGGADCPTMAPVFVLGFRVGVHGFRVWGLGFRIQGLGLGFRFRG